MCEFYLIAYCFQVVDFTDNKSPDAAETSQQKAMDVGGGWYTIALSWYHLVTRVIVCCLHSSIRTLGYNGADINKLSAAGEYLLCDTRVPRLNASAGFNALLATSNKNNFHVVNKDMLILSKNRN